MNAFPLPPTQAYLLQQATSSLAALLGQPVAWHATPSLTITINQHPIAAWVELHLRQVCPCPTPALLVTPYLPAQQAEQLRAAGQSYLDGAGNAYLRTSTQFVLIQGRPRPKPVNRCCPPTSPLPLASLRILYYLLSKPDLLQATYRQLSQVCGVSLGSIHTFFSKARQQQLLREQPGRKWQWGSLAQGLAKWVQGYEQVIRPMLHPRGYRWQAGVEPGLGWRQLPLPSGAYWSGEAGAHLLIGERHSCPASFTLFSPSIPTTWGLLPDSQLGQVELLLPPFPLPPVTGTIPPLLTYTELRLASSTKHQALARYVLDRELPHLGGGV